MPLCLYALCYFHPLSLGFNFHVCRADAPHAAAADMKGAHLT